ncbi:MAG: hypothetical protein IJF87_06130 [Erysipelotrichaceae bacterium]|nr:hypothetical protein [Erysipelotrichaceae bacterium]
MKKLNEMNGTEKIAYRNIKGIFNWNVGGWYNCIQDNCPEYIPDTEEEAKELIYSDALENTAGEGWYQCGTAPKEMRFAGKEFIKDVIDSLFEEDADVSEIGFEKGWFEAAETKEEDLTEAMALEANEDFFARDAKKEHRLPSLEETIKDYGLHIDNKKITIIDKIGNITFEGEVNYLFGHRCKTLLNTTVKYFSITDSKIILNREYLPIKVK